MFTQPAQIFRIILVCFIIYAALNPWQINDLEKNSSKIWFYNGQKVIFQGVVEDYPDWRIDHVKLTVRTLTVNSLEVTGKVLVSTSLYPSYQYGDLLEVECLLKAPEIFNGFSYDRYLAKSDIYSICSYPVITLLSRGNGDYLFTKVYNFKKRVHELINFSLPEPQASMISAMLLGIRKGMPQDLVDKFNVTGTTHLLAISGLHITILFTVLMKLSLSLYISRKKSFWIISGLLFTYLLLIGFPASAVRAGIMGWLLMLSLYLGKLNTSINSVLLAASIMIFINPNILRDDIGFQLSFAATIGIIYFSPLFETHLKNFKNYFGFREVMIMSLSAYLATLPLVIFYFERISLVGIFANLLVIPAIAYIIIFSLLAISLSLLIPTWSLYFFIPVWILLSYVMQIINLFSLIPYAAINV